MASRKDRRRGFLLIELVVTVAIIALLAAMLAPVFATARKQVYQYDCSSRQQQLGKAVLMYTQDYDEGLPVGAAVDYFNDSTIACWDASVSPYTSYQGPLESVATLARAGALYRCPIDRASRLPGATRSFAMTLTGDACFGPSRGVLGDWSRVQRTLYTKPRALPALTDTTGTLLLVEFFHPLNRLFGAWAAGIHGPVFAPGDCGTGALAQIFPAVPGGPEPQNHLGGFNYVFCDSHAKWLKPTQTFGPRGRPGDPQGMWTIDESD